MTILKFKFTQMKSSSKIKDDVETKAIRDISKGRDMLDNMGSKLKSFLEGRKEK